MAIQIHDVGFGTKLYLAFRDGVWAAWRRVDYERPHELCGLGNFIYLFRPWCCFIDNARNWWNYWRLFNQILFSFVVGVPVFVHVPVFATAFWAASHGRRRHDSYSDGDDQHDRECDRVSPPCESRFHRRHRCTKRVLYQTGVHRCHCCCCCRRHLQISVLIEVLCWLCSRLRFRCDCRSLTVRQRICLIFLLDSLFLQHHPLFRLLSTRLLSVFAYIRATTHVVVHTHTQ